MGFRVQFRVQGSQSRVHIGGLEIQGLQVLEGDRSRYRDCEGITKVALKVVRSAQGLFSASLAWKSDALRVRLLNSTVYRRIYQVWG